MGSDSNSIAFSFDTEACLSVAIATNGELSRECIRVIGGDDLW
jgi:hypothetical protein